MSKPKLIETAALTGCSESLPDSAFKLAKTTKYGPETRISGERCNSSYVTHPHNLFNKKFNSINMKQSNHLNSTARKGCGHTDKYDRFNKSKQSSRPIRTNFQDFDLGASILQAISTKSKVSFYTGSGPRRYRKMEVIKAPKVYRKVSDTFNFIESTKTNLKVKANITKKSLWNVDSERKHNFDLKLVREERHKTSVSIKPFVNHRLCKTLKSCMKILKPKSSRVTTCTDIIFNDFASEVGLETLNKKSKKTVKFELLEERIVNYSNALPIAKCKAAFPSVRSINPFIAKSKSVISNKGEAQPLRRSCVYNNFLRAVGDFKFIHQQRRKQLLLEDVRKFVPRYFDVIYENNERTSMFCLQTGEPQDPFEFIPMKLGKIVWYPPRQVDDYDHYFYGVALLATSNKIYIDRNINDFELESGFGGYACRTKGDRMMMEGENPNHTAYGRRLAKLGKRDRKRLIVKPKNPQNRRQRQFTQKTQDIHRFTPEAGFEKAAKIVGTVVKLSTVGQYILPRALESYEQSNYGELLSHFIHSIVVLCYDPSVVAEISKKLFEEASSEVFTQIKDIIEVRPDGSYSQIWKIHDSYEERVFFTNGEWYVKQLPEIDPRRINIVYRATEGHFEPEGISEMWQYLQSLVPKLSTILSKVVGTTFMQKLLAVATIGFFTRLFSTIGLQELGATVDRVVKKIDFSDFSIRTIIDLFSELKEFITMIITGNFDEYQDPYVSWVEEYFLLLRTCATDASISHYKPEMTHIDRLFALQARVQRTQTRGREILKGTRHRNTNMVEQMARLAIISEDLTAKISAVSYLPSPYVIHLVGGAGLGKTALRSQLITYLEDILDVDRNDVYVMTNQEFHAGYSSQRVIVFDDMNQLKDESFNSRVNQTFIDLCSNMPTQATMADLADKGKVFMHAKLIIVTSNSFDAGAQDVYKYAVAGMRRLRHVIEFDTEEYRGDDDQYVHQTVVKYKAYVREVEGSNGRQVIVNRDLYEGYDLRKVISPLREEAKTWVTKQNEIVNGMRQPETWSDAVAALPPLIRIISRRPAAIEWFGHNFGTHYIIHGLNYILVNLFDFEGLDLSNLSPYSKVKSIILSPFLQTAVFWYLSFFNPIIYLIAFPLMGIFESFDFRYLRFDPLTAFVKTTQLAIFECLPFGTAFHLIYNLFVIFEAPQLYMVTKEVEFKKNIFTSITDVVATYYGLLAVFSAITMAYNINGFYQRRLDEAYERGKKEAVQVEAIGDPITLEQRELSSQIDLRIGTQNLTQTNGAPNLQAYNRIMTAYLPNTGTKGRLETISRCIVDIRCLIPVDGIINRGKATLIGNTLWSSTHVFTFDDKGNTEIEFCGQSIVVSKIMTHIRGELIVFVLTQNIARSLTRGYVQEIPHDTGGTATVAGQVFHYEFIQPKVFEVDGKQFIVDIRYNTGKALGHGHSGSPIIISTKNTIVIGGVHVGSTHEHGYGVSFKNEFIEFLQTTRSWKNGGSMISVREIPSLNMKDPIKLEALHEKSILRYIGVDEMNKFPTMIPEGTYRIKPKPNPSRIIRTPLYDHIKGIEKYAIPNFKSRVEVRNEEEVWIDPHLVNLATIKNYTMVVRQDIVRSAVVTLANLLRKSEKFPLQQPLTLQQAINGIPGVLNSLDLRTSGGPGFAGQKGNFVTGSHPNLHLTPDVLSSMINMLDIMDQNEACMPLFQASLKDEVIKAQKNNDGKVRQFYGCNIPFQVLTRILYGPTYIWMAQNRHQLPFKIGVNVTSAEWEKMYHEFEKRGVFYESDIGEFDKSNSIQKLGIQLFIELMLQAGYPQSQVRIAELLAQSSVQYYLDVLGSLLAMYSCAPSGAPGTTYNNSATVLFVFFLAYVLSLAIHLNITFDEALLRDEVDQFLSLVYVCVYGDDLAVALYPKVTEFLRAETIHAVFLGLGFKLTNADKSPGIPQFHTDIQKITFLKRSFRPVTFQYTTSDGNQQSINTVVAPLEQASTEKMLAFFEDKGNITLDEYLQIVSKEAMIQAFFRGHYETQLKFFNELPHDLKSKCRVDLFPTEKELTDQYCSSLADNKPFTIWV